MRAGRSPGDVPARPPRRRAGLNFGNGRNRKIPCRSYAARPGPPTRSPPTQTCERLTTPSARDPRSVPSPRTGRPSPPRGRRGGWTSTAMNTTARPPASRSQPCGASRCGASHRTSLGRGARTDQRCDTWCSSNPPGTAYGRRGADLHAGRSIQLRGMLAPRMSNRAPLARTESASSSKGV